jgi:IclR family transcriptional regulator, KDG regulon repressor
MAIQKERYHINSVLRAAQILESFNKRKAAYTNTELSKKLNLNKSTITRLLYSLEAAGFIEREEDTGKYKLTYRLYKIGNAAISQVSFHTETMPVLAELVRATRETGQLTILENNEVSIIDRIETPRSIGLMGSAGINLPAYCSATGKILLAYRSEKELDDYFAAVTMKAYTPNTITDPDELRLQLKSIRKQGYAICNAELEKQVVGVASPIRDKTGKVLACISTAGPAFRMAKKQTSKDIIKLVTTAAATISERLGYIDLKK